MIIRRYRWLIGRIRTRGEQQRSATLMSDGWPPVGRRTVLLTLPSLCCPQTLAHPLFNNCGWVFSHFLLQPFWPSKCLYGWALSTCLEKLRFEEKQKCFRQISVVGNCGMVRESARQAAAIGVGSGVLFRHVDVCVLIRRLVKKAGIYDAGQGHFDEEGLTLWSHRGNKRRAMQIRLWCGRCDFTSHGVCFLEVFTSSTLELQIQTPFPAVKGPSAQDEKN